MQNMETLWPSVSHVLYKNCAYYTSIFPIAIFPYILLENWLFHANMQGCVKVIIQQYNNLDENVKK